VKVKYTGKLLSDGFEFYSATNEPSATFDSRVINYIFGMQVALPKLPVGSKATLYIPSGLGFGDQVINSGSASVPANSNLIYEVELLGIVN
jgi:FKBP-type peptidyl-prolyl cis-trans isomerase FklB